ncbi:MAG: dihydropteroate synthase [Bacteroidetes bacterium]|nr:dihydropteroate synthase [Bacteroidota bacterium]
MAIINLTPDSFYDGGKYQNIKDILIDIETKIEAGADILDIGAASSRPGSTETSEEEEWNRLKETLPKIRKAFPEIFISADTYRATIAQKTADEGADMINDISGGNFDSEMFGTMAKLQLPYILMHIQGTPQTMQKAPSYTNVVIEVLEILKGKIQQLQQLNFNKIILDPGFGFGKETQHNYKLLKEMKLIGALGFPLLAGISRKGMINKVIKTNPQTALNGTAVLNTIALLNGASILRVHDVAEAKQAIELVQFYKNS